MGFIGLGTMGDPMCRSLVAGGRALVVPAGGDAAGVPTPVTAAAQQLFSIARERGFGDHDVSAVLRAPSAR